MKKIAVIGAGPAGLRAAMLLEKEGHDVVVYEARDRIGGRLETIALPGGGFYEAGGEWIDSDHHHCLDLLDELDIEPEAANSRNANLFIDGEMSACDQPWDDVNSDLEAIDEETKALLADLPEDPVTDPNSLEMDVMTLGSYLDHCCDSERGREAAELIHRAAEGEDTKNISLLGWLISQKTSAKGESNSYRFPGGAGKVCEHMAATLSRRPILNRSVRSIQATEDHVEVWAGDEMAFVDFVILCIPPNALAEIDFAESIPPDTELAWHSVGCTRTIMVVLGFSEPFWEKQGWDGSALSDLACQQIWSAGRGGAAVLASLVCGDEAERLAAEGDPVEAVYAAVCKIAPEASKYYRGGQVHSWLADPFSRGGSSFLPPGGLAGTGKNLGKMMGRIHFAGEAFSPRIGSIEGALESAARAAKEINDAAQTKEPSGD